MRTCVGVSSGSPSVTMRVASLPVSSEPTPDALAGEPLGKLLADPSTEPALIRRIKDQARTLSTSAGSKEEHRVANTLYYAALAHALSLVEEGDDLIDVGGESTRPGAAGVSAEEELARVRPLLERLCPRAGVPVSIDTSKPLVAEAALDLGVRVLNDVSGLGETSPRGLPVLAELAQRYGASLFVMHMQGEPRTMQEEPHYEDVVHDVG